MRNAIVLVLLLLGIGVFVLWFQEMRKTKKGNDMYEGDSVEDEIEQNVYDQQHPPWTAPTEQLTAMPHEPTVAEQILGLSKRQVDLIHNKDNGLPQTGAARERRLQIIHRDIDAISKFLPYLDQVRGFMSTMPTEDDEGLIEALSLADMKLKQFISEVTAKLSSLEQELELKKVIV